jgi:ubiquitin-conjugating enzyme E2 O
MPSIPEGIYTKQFYVQDLVRPKKLTAGVAVKFGSVLRTRHDIDTHNPHPQSEYEDEISRGKNVGSALFQRFLHDGIPPKDTVLVQWLPIIVDASASSSSCELVSVKDILLIDRPILLGDTVKRDPKSPLAGTVVNLHVHCNLVQFGYAPLGRASQTLTGISGSELSPASNYRETAMIILHGWVGRIDTVDSEVAIQLHNHSVVVVPEAELTFLMLPSTLSEGPQAGEWVRTKKGVLRRGRWVFGSYNANVEAAGQVVERRAVRVSVRWLYQNPRSKRHPRPPDVLTTDLLESEDVLVYDR